MAASAPRATLTAIRTRAAKIAAIGAVAVCVVASYWLWLAPGGAPGCDGIAACTSSVDLDTSALDFDVDNVQRRGVFVSPDGDTVVVIARGPRAGDEPSDTAIASFDVATGDHIRTYLDAEVLGVEPFDTAIASFDVATGDHIRTYLDAEVLGVEQIAISPDGSVLAVSHYREGGPFSDEIFLYDFTTGELLNTLQQECSYSLGLSADNTLLQCQANVFDIASGDVVDSPQKLGTNSLSDYLVTVPGQADLRQTELLLADHAGNRTATIALTDTDRRLGDHVQLQGTPDGDRVLYLAESEGDPFWKPRPQRIKGWLAVFDVGQTRHVGTFELDTTPAGVAVTHDGSKAVVIDADFRVQSFNVDQIVSEAS